MSTAFTIGPDGPPLLLGRLDDGADVARLHLEGEIDLAVAPALERLLRDLTRDQQPTLVVDLHAVTFCDLAGLRVLMAAHEANGGRVTVDGPPPSLVRLLECVGADDWSGILPRSNH